MRVIIFHTNSYDQRYAEQKYNVDTNVIQTALTFQAWGTCAVVSAERVTNEVHVSSYSLRIAAQ